MIVTQIKRIAKTNRYHVYVDGQWLGVFLDETLAREKIRTGEKIDCQRLKEIKQENDSRLAFDIAATYMEKYIVSEKGIKDYLKKKNFDAGVISQTIEKLKDYGFVDDEKFAKNYVESVSTGHGKNAIANKLRLKGVSKEIIDEITDNIDEEDELEKAVTIANKFVKNREKTLKTKQKCIAHLIYKGYDYSVAQKASNTAIDIVYEGENDDRV